MVIRLKEKNTRYIILNLIWMLLCTAHGSVSKFRTDRDRFALVIGNTTYSSPPLPNTDRDAQDIAKKLSSLGFKVDLLIDANKKQITEHVNSLCDTLKGGGFGFFYFSGHGVQVNGDNYLVPIGYNVNKESDIEFECYSLSRLLSGLKNAGNDSNLVVLDACRDNPFQGSAKTLGNEGLAQVNAPTGTLVAYACAPGAKSSANPEGHNSLYTQALLNNLDKPGLSLTQVFHETRREVKRDSGGRQIPWEEDSTIDEFYFVGGSAPKTSQWLPAVPGTYSFSNTLEYFKGQGEVVVSDHLSTERELAEFSKDSLECKIENGALQISSSQQDGRYRGAYLHVKVEDLALFVTVNFRSGVASSAPSWAVMLRSSGSQAIFLTGHTDGTSPGICGVEFWNRDHWEGGRTLALADAWRPREPFNLYVRLSGTSLKVWIDERFIGEIKDVPLSGAGGIGLGVGAAATVSYKGLIVTKLGG
jgi:Caspase domain